MADLSVQIAGLILKNPVLPGAGPNVDGAGAIMTAAGAGVGGLLSHTAQMVATPAISPPSASVTRDTLIHLHQHSPRSFAEWVASDYPAALAAARGYKVPFIAAISGTAGEMQEMARMLTGLGVDGIELSLAGTERAEILPTVQALRAAVQLPILAKLSPHHGDDLAALAAELEPYVDAFTCIGGFGPVMCLDVAKGAAALGSPFGYGYLSGASIRPVAQRFVFEVARRVSKPVIGCGGITSGRDAIEMLMLGASAVQVCTHALVHGPAVYGQIAREISDWLDAHGYQSIARITGLYIRKYGHGQRVVLEKEESPHLEPEKCIKCTICGRVCFYDAITAPPKSLPEILHDPCFECGLCVSACPTGALSFKPRDLVTMLPAPTK